MDHEQKSEHDQISSRRRQALARLGLGAAMLYAAPAVAAVTVNTAQTMVSSKHGGKGGTPGGPGGPGGPGPHH